MSNFGHRSERVSCWKLSRVLAAVNDSSVFPCMRNSRQPIYFSHLWRCWARNLANQFQCWIAWAFFGLTWIDFSINFENVSWWTLHGHVFWTLLWNKLPRHNSRSNSKLRRRFNRRFIFGRRKNQSHSCHLLLFEGLFLLWRYRSGIVLITWRTCPATRRRAIWLAQATGRSRSWSRPNSRAVASLDSME